MRPEVLLLDEPLAGLDARAAARLVCVLDDLEGAMIVVTHDGDEVGPLGLRPLRLAGGRLHAV